ncbi:MAG: LicD family protein [Prevotella sp.]|nr:LicD family protein [Prevotella sp.]
MKEISYDELRSIQLEILDFVDDFCRNNSIKYSLAYGTLLGAVRHGGYIPWDDDIDIAMLRDDYERFANVFNKSQTLYRFYDCRNDKEVHIAFGKVVDTRTMIEEGANTKNLGVAIDVFPIDDLCNTYKASCRFYHSFDMIKNLLIMKCRRISEVRSWWKKPFFAAVKVLTVWYPLHKLPIIITNRLLRHRYPDSKYVGPVVDGCENEIVGRNIWSEFCEIPFEGRMFNAIKDYDVYLKNAYGDYMQLPPEKDRVPKHDFYKMYWL